MKENLVVSTESWPITVVERAAEKLCCGVRWEQAEACRAKREAEVSFARATLSSLPVLYGRPADAA